MAAHCSERERESARIEHEADDVCAAYLLERELRERGPDAEFEGEVSGVIRRVPSFPSAASWATSTRAFCRPAGCGASTLSWTAPRPLWSAAERERVRLGDPIAVGVGGIEASRGRVDLEPAGG